MASEREHEVNQNKIWENNNKNQVSQKNLTTLNFRNYIFKLFTCFYALFIVIGGVVVELSNLISNGSQIIHTGKDLVRIKAKWRQFHNNAFRFLEYGCLEGRFCSLDTALIWSTCIIWTCFIRGENIVFRCSIKQEKSLMF